MTLKALQQNTILYLTVSHPLRHGKLIEHCHQSLLRPQKQMDLYVEELKGN